MAPQPRLRTGFFSTLTQDAIPEDKIREACTSVGMAKFGSPIDLQEEIIVDLIVVGSTAGTSFRLYLAESAAFNRSPDRSVSRTGTHQAWAPSPFPLHV